MAEILMARARERMLALLIGAFCILLGFFLFIFVPTSPAGNGKLAWADTEVVLTHVGPGVFFALFGAFVTWLSIRTQLQIGPEAESAAADTGTGTHSTVRYLIATEGKTDKQAVDSARSRHLRDFRTLDKISSIFGAAERDSVEIPANLRVDLELAVPRIKESVMFAVWDDDWGDYAAFSRWVQDGASDPPPEGINTPAQFFYGKSV